MFFANNKTPPLTKHTVNPANPNALTRADVLCVLAPLALVLFFFWKTIFLGQAISNLDLLNKLDLVFNPALKGSSLSVTVDPTPCLQMIPGEIFAEHTLFRHEIPLWNDLTGCGRPFAADLQSPNWAFLNLLFSANNPYLYNLGIVIKLAFGIIGTFLLARFSGVSRYSAAFVSSAFYFCPRMLRLFELGSNTYFYPWILLSFLWLARSPSLARATTVAILTAFVFYSMHPEVFFVIVMCGVALAFASLYERSSPFFQNEPARERLLKLAQAITTTGILSVCLASPVLFLFLEYLKNASCYKYADSGCSVLSAAEYLLNVFTPTSSGTVFLGSIVALLLPIGMIAACKNRSPFVLLLAALFLYSTRPLGLEHLLSKPPFSYLLPEYTLYPCIFISSIVAGIGLDQFFLHRTIKSWLTNAILLCSTCWIAFLQLAPSLGLTSIFGIALAPGVSTKVLVLNLTLIAASTLLIRYGSHLAKILPFPLIALLLLVVNFASLYKFSFAEMKPRPPFTLAAPEAVQILQQLPHRMVATGDRTFQANLHLIYGVQDLRSTGPLNPSRYTEFVEAAGMHQGYCNTLTVPASFNRFLDLSSTRYILSTAPVTGTEPDGLSPTTPVSGGKIINGLRLLHGTVFFNPQDRSLTGNLFFRVHGNISDRYEAQTALLDNQGHEISSSVSHLLNSEGPGNSEHRQTIPISLPLPVDCLNKNVCLVVYITDLWTGQNVVAQGRNLKHLGKGFVACTLSQETLQTAVTNQTGKTHFRLIHELKSGMRIYENTAALPPAYLATHPIYVGADKALMTMQNKDFCPQKDVVIEPESAGNFKQTADTAIATNDITANVLTVKRMSPNKVSVSVRTDHPGWLVLTDTFYPGWKATIDSTEVPIFRANYFFRAVPIPAGKHTVTYVYDPVVFKLGVILLFAGIIFIASVLFISSRKKAHAQQIVDANGKDATASQVT